MNRKETTNLLPIIQAFSEGKTIIVKDKRLPDEEDSWSETDDCSFDIEKFDYRIKPEPKYHPFANAEECWKEMQKHQPFGWVKHKDFRINIANVMSKAITFADNEGRNFTFEQVFKEYTFDDGNPFGVKVEEEN